MTAEERAAADAPDKDAQELGDFVLPVELSFLVTMPTGEKLRTASVGSGECVLAIKQALQDAAQTCCYTAYRLLLQAADGELTLLNDLQDIASYPGLVGGAELIMAPDAYDEQSVKAHVHRLKDALLFPPAIAPTYQLGAEADAGADMDGDAKDGPAAKHAEDGPEDGRLEQLQAEFRTAIASLAARPLAEPSGPPLSAFVDEILVSADGASGGGPEAAPVECLSSLALSPHHPPSSARRMAGDLAYLVATTVEGTELHITANAQGFYLNRSTSGALDPRPTASAAFSHALLHTLAAASASFAERWRRAVERAGQRQKELGPLGMLRAMAQQGRLEHVMPRAPWCTLASEQHRPAEDGGAFAAAALGDAASTWRDWNDEVQAVREMPSETAEEKLQKAKLLHRLLRDFNDAVLEGAKAIVESRMRPINAHEPERQHLYLSNNIFFSIAVDARGAWAPCGGDWAVYRNFQRETSCISRIADVIGTEVPAVFTLAQSVVDYMGVRVLGQSIIPGILQERCTAVVYGAIEPQQPLACDAAVHERMQSLFGRLAVAERELPQPSEGAVRFSGPSDAKGILGSDGRSYLLDCTRVAPRDANFVADGRGTGLWRRAGAEVEAPSLAHLSGEALRESAEGAAGRVPSLLVAGGISEEDSAAVYAQATLRPEAIERFIRRSLQRHRAERREKRRAEAAEGAEESEPSAEEQAAALEAERALLAGLALNVNCFLPGREASADAAEAARDEDAAREIATWLWEEEIPSWVAGTRAGLPGYDFIDGESLVDSLHGRGINVRYLGLVAALCAAEEERDAELAAMGKPRRVAMPLHVLELAEIEMLCRAAKHCVREFFDASPEARRSPAAVYAALLNAILGGGGAGEARGRDLGGGGGDPGADGGTASELSRLLQHALSIGAPVEANGAHAHAQGAQKQRRRRKKGDGGGQVAGTPQARKLAQAIGPLRVSVGVPEPAGVALAARLTRDAVWRRLRVWLRRLFRVDGLRIWGAGPAAAGPAAGGRIPHAARRGFVPMLRRLCQRLGLQVLRRDYDFSLDAPLAVSSIVGVRPVARLGAARHPLPEIVDGCQLARAQLSRGEVVGAQALARDMYSFAANVCGLASTESADALETLAVCAQNCGDSGTATAYMERAVSLYCEAAGLDAFEVEKATYTMGLLLRSAMKVGPALRHFAASYAILTYCAGPRHSKARRLALHIGELLQQCGLGQDALAWVEQSLEGGQARDALDTAKAYRVLAALHGDLGRYSKALDAERAAHALYARTIGPEQQATQASAAALKQYTAAAVQQRKQEVASEKLAKAAIATAGKKGRKKRR